MGLYTGGLGTRSAILATKRFPSISDSVRDRFPLFLLFLLFFFSFFCFPLPLLPLFLILLSGCCSVLFTVCFFCLVSSPSCLNALALQASACWLETNSPCFSHLSDVPWYLSHRSEVCTLTMLVSGFVWAYIVGLSPRQDLPLAGHGTSHRSPKQGSVFCPGCLELSGPDPLVRGF